MQDKKVELALLPPPRESKRRHPGSARGDVVLAMFDDNGTPFFLLFLFLCLGAQEACITFLVGVRCLMAASSGYVPCEPRAPLFDPHGVLIQLNGNGSGNVLQEEIHQCEIL